MCAFFLTFSTTGFRLGFFILICFRLFKPQTYIPKKLKSRVILLKITVEYLAQIIRYLYSIFGNVKNAKNSYSARLTRIIAVLKKNRNGRLKPSLVKRNKNELIFCCSQKNNYR
jgi:hypothetical protein